ncbi:MAG: peptide deformylase [Rickettsiales bacterium]|nr:peptide deformylase [Rickettsiales bacterium]
MALLSLIYAPDPIFKQTAERVDAVTDETRRIIDDMFETVEHEKAVGIGANMVGVLKRLAVVDLQEGGISKPYAFINPEIFWYSDEQQEHEEASICFLGIAAKVKRPATIKLRYLDYEGQSQALEATGFFASVIQHEVDYLDGITFLDHLSKLKRDMLLKKMKKHLKHHPPHVHGTNCNH